MFGFEILLQNVQKLQFRRSYFQDGEMFLQNASEFESNEGIERKVFGIFSIRPEFLGGSVRIWRIPLFVCLCVCVCIFRNITPVIYLSDYSEILQFLFSFFFLNLFTRFLPHYGLSFGCCDSRDPLGTLESLFGLENGATYLESKESTTEFNNLERISEESRNNFGIIASRSQSKPGRILT